MAPGRGEQDRGGAWARQLPDAVEELVEDAREIEAGREGLREFLDHLGRGLQRGRGRVGRTLDGAGGGWIPGGAEGGDLLQEAELLVGLLEQAMELAARERLEEHEVGGLDVVLLVRIDPRSYDAHYHRTRAEVSRTRDEPGETARRTDDLLDDQLHLGEPQSPQCLVVGRGGEH